MIQGELGAARIARDAEGAKAQALETKLTELRANIALVEESLEYFLSADDDVSILL